MNLHAVTRFAADGMVDCLVAGMIIALLAWAVTCLVRRQGPSTRFAVWFLALAAIVLLPVVGNFAAGSSNGVSSLPAKVLTLPAWFAFFLFAVWIAGASLGLLHVAHGLYRLQRLRATCTPIDLGALDPSLRNLLAVAQKHRRVTLCTSDAIRVPAAIGYFRPMVVFPSWALAEIAPAELNAILLHELSHLRRWDDWTNLAQKIVKPFSSFIPRSGSSSRALPWSAKWRATMPCWPPASALALTRNRWSASPRRVSFAVEFSWPRLRSARCSS